VLCLATAATGATALVSSAQAATRWSAPTVLATGHHYTLPFELKTLADGTSIAVFYDTEPNANYTHDNGHADVAVRPPGGSFGLPYELTDPGQLPIGLVTNFAGDSALFVYTSTGLMLVPRPRGAGFQSVESLPQGAIADGYLSENGDLTFTGGPSGGPPWVDTRTADGTYTPPRPIETAPKGWYYGAQPTVEPNGSITLTGRQGEDSSNVLSVTAPAGGPFGPPETIATHSRSFGGQIKIAHDARGDTLIAWNGGSASGTFQFGSLHTAYRPAGGHWGAPEQIPGDPFDRAQDFDLAMNARGDAVLEWNELGRTAMSYRSAGGDWEPATQAPQNEETLAWEPTMDPTLAIGPTGDAIVVYAAGTYRRCLEALDHPAGAGFQRAEPVLDQDGRNADLPKVAVGPHGNAIVGWWGNTDANHDPDPGAFWTASHQISALPANTPPSVTCFGAAGANGGVVHAASKGPAAVFYRLSRRARIELRVRRLRRSHYETLATLHRRGIKGGNRVVLPSGVARKLAAKGRYQLRIVAIDKSGRRSRPRTLTFKR